MGWEIESVHDYLSSLAVIFISYSFHIALYHAHSMDIAFLIYVKSVAWKGNFILKNIFLYPYRRLYLKIKQEGEKEC